jgi:hypothetical protein
VLGTIALGEHPAFAASDDKGHVFVNLMSIGAVERIDSRNLTIAERWPVPCGGPNNETMAIDKKHRQEEWEAVRGMPPRFSSHDVPARSAP